MKEKLFLQRWDILRPRGGSFRDERCGSAVVGAVDRGCPAAKPQGQTPVKRIGEILRERRQDGVTFGVDLVCGVGEEVDRPGGITVLEEIFGLVPEELLVATQDVIHAIKRALRGVTPAPERQKLQLVDADIAIIDHVRVLDEVARSLRNAARKSPRDRPEEP